MEAPARCVFGGRPGPSSHSPAITTTTPSTVWRRVPLPRLLTMFRPMQPATRTNRIHLKKGMARVLFYDRCSVGAVGLRLWVVRQAHQARREDLNGRAKAPALRLLGGVAGLVGPEAKRLGLSIKAKSSGKGASQPLLLAMIAPMKRFWTGCKGLSGHCIGVASATLRHGEFSSAEATRLGAQTRR